MNKQWMIYGANGYTGELIAREAVNRGEKPVLAGRTLSKIQPLADELGLEAVAFNLNSIDQAAAKIAGNTLVMHCAGPFSATADPMMEACIKAGAHYLDITGEIAVFELAQSKMQAAKKAGVVICSGVGFDVIPTDCVAARLKEVMPDATHLTLGFDSSSGVSPGTAKTNLEGLAQGGKVRVSGQIVTVPMAHKVRQINFGRGVKSAMTIPWGDVSTAFHTTGIPNVEVFIPGSFGTILGAKLSRFFRPIFAMAWVQKRLKAFIEKSVKGPDETTRADLPTFIWGEARNAKGELKTARVRTVNTYSLTITGALAVINHLLSNEPEGGAYTPARLVGSDLVCRLPGSSQIHVE